MWPDKLAPLLFIMLIIVFSIAIPTWLFWLIFRRTGMNPALSLLTLVPSVGFLIVLAILAFSRWPALDPVGPVSAFPATPPVGAGWLPDPKGEHRLRYWDGVRWTGNVSD